VPDVHLPDEPTLDEIDRQREEPDVDDVHDCEICREACPSDQQVCDECESLVDEMREEESRC
jgi:hypothetical protein